MNKMFIEVRVNEYKMRDDTPHIPWTAMEIADEAARCADAGATLFHWHGRTDDGGIDNTLEKYQEVIRLIRKKADILLMPTLGFVANDEDPDKRINIQVQLSMDPQTAPDIVPIDMGSMNYEFYHADTKSFEYVDRIYHNSTDTIISAAQRFQNAGLGLMLVCWNVGFVRRAAALMDMGILKEPALFELNLSGGPVITGHPATVTGLDCMVEMLPKNRKLTYLVDCTGGPMMSLVPYIIRSGGNVSIGLGDYHYSELGMPDNSQLISKCAQMAREFGREIMTTDELRKLLGLKKRS